MRFAAFSKSLYDLYDGKEEASGAGVGLQTFSDIEYSTVVSDFRLFYS
jgi:hypothetical protein